MNDYRLQPDQVAFYQNNGYLFPLSLFDTSQVGWLLDNLQQARDEAAKSGLEQEFARLIRTNVHYLLPFVYEAARSPQLIHSVASILGNDLMLWSAEFFIKPARTDKIVSWHQDLTYWGLGETDQEMTAWVALSDVTVESGCMRFMPGSHHEKILPHRDTFADTNLLSRGQELDTDIDENKAVDIVLEPGQVSFHHGRMFHASGPNVSANDRIGLVFRFITPEVRQLVAARDYAMLVHGKNTSTNWIQVAPPLCNLDPEYIALREQVQQEQAKALGAGAKQVLYQAT